MRTLEAPTIDLSELSRLWIEGTETDLADSPAGREQDVQLLTTPQMNTVTGDPACVTTSKCDTWSTCCTTTCGTLGTRGMCGC